MKTLIVYYSRTNTTKKVAGLLAEKLGADLEELIDQKDRSGVSGYVIAGKDAMQGNPTKIGECKYDPSLYDLVIIGTPVWAWRMTPAVRTYLDQYGEKIPRIALFDTQGGEGSKKVLPEIEELLHKKSLANMQLLTKEVVRGEFVQKVDDFLKEIDENSKKS